MNALGFGRVLWLYRGLGSSDLELRVFGSDRTSVKSWTSDCRLGRQLIKEKATKSSKTSKGSTKSCLLGYRCKDRVLPLGKGCPNGIFGATLAVCHSERNFREAVRKGSPPSASSKRPNSRILTICSADARWSSGMEEGPEVSLQEVSGKSGHHPAAREECRRQGVAQRWRECDGHNSDGRGAHVAEV